MNKVEVTRKAAKQLRKLQPSDRKLIIAESYKLAAMPNCQNVKALTKHKYPYRLRVGNFRIFFKYESVIKIVTIEEVKKRDDNTY